MSGVRKFSAFLQPCISKGKGISTDEKLDPQTQNQINISTTLVKCIWLVQILDFQFPSQQEIESNSQAPNTQNSLKSLLWVVGGSEILVLSLRLKLSKNGTGHSNLHCAQQLTCFQQFLHRAELLRVSLYYILFWPLALTIYNMKEIRWKTN